LYFDIWFLDFTKSMSLIFLFIDGVGLGDENDHNPFMQQSYEAFTNMADGQPFTSKAGMVTGEKHLFKSIDATLNVEGLPQSGTGQTALFSGENAPKVIGKHFGPFPHSGIKHLLREQSLFIKAHRQGKSCHFINAYPDIFFKKSQKRNRWSCTTLMTKSAGLSLNGSETVRQQNALTAGLTQKGWRDHLNIDIPVIEPAEAARRLLKQSRHYDLLLHEYYLTDKAGHSQDESKASSILTTYDHFLQILIEEKDPGYTLVLSSDHGNVEDLSTKTHTLNRVPLFVYGPGARSFEKAQSITDVTPAILKVLDKYKTDKAEDADVR
jgi:hypothetical protein